MSTPDSSYKLLFSLDKTDSNIIHVVIRRKVVLVEKDIFRGYMVIDKRNAATNELRAVSSVVEKAGISSNNLLVLSPVHTDSEDDNILNKIDSSYSIGKEIARLETVYSLVKALKADTNLAKLENMSLLPIDNVVLVIRHNSNDEILCDEELHRLEQRLEHSGVVESLYIKGKDN